MDDYVARACDYADKVIQKEIPACVYVIQACKRFVTDLDRDDLVLNVELANRWCRFLERLPHTKGKWASTNQSLKLSEYQIFSVVNIFGWQWVSNGRRRFRQAYIEVPRKNGKTLFVAGIGVGMLTIEEEHGAEIYCGATSEKQAWEVFKPAKEICKKLPALRERFGIQVNAKTIIIEDKSSKFEPVIGNPGDGASPSLGIADEFHEHKSGDLVETFETGMGAREQPLMFYITTAGSDMGGPCYEKRADVVNVLSGAVKDDSIFGLIYTIDEDDDWTTVEAQKKANPNYGVSVDPEFLKGQLLQAKRSAVKAVSYKTKHLNLWVGAKTAWMNMLAYQACRRRDLSIENYRGRRCFIGLDFASKIDIACMALVFPPLDNRGKYAVFCRHYLPEEVILDSATSGSKSTNNSIYRRYKGWHSDGWLTATPGNVIDFEYIENDLIALKSEYEIVEIPYDPFQATQFSTRMLDAGFPMVEYGATVKNFSDPMKELEALIIEKAILFQMDPVLAWMFGNVTAKEDLKGNVFPNKARKENKIDGVVATIMGLARVLAHSSKESVYKSRGLVSAS